MTNVTLTTSIEDIIITQTIFLINGQSILLNYDLSNRRADAIFDFEIGDLAGNIANIQLVLLVDDILPNFDDNSISPNNGSTFTGDLSFSFDFWDNETDIDLNSNSFTIFYENGNSIITAGTISFVVSAQNVTINTYSVTLNRNSLTLNNVIDEDQSFLINITDNNNNLIQRSLVFRTDALAPTVEE